MSCVVDRRDTHWHGFLPHGLFQGAHAEVFLDVMERLTVIIAANVSFFGGRGSNPCPAVPRIFRSGQEQQT